MNKLAMLLASLMIAGVSVSSYAAGDKKEDGAKKEAAAKKDNKDGMKKEEAKK
ncbi:MAG: hypothetical protein QM520_03915 [Gammaproteobacteria bacterium]|nr:hypothetical protein [Gammaproteobacteria bacterium]